MGIYIPDMEMPKGCYDCQLKMDCYECEGLNCFCLPLFRQIGDGMGNVELPKDKREEDCPLVHVQPHGRLGDLDALKAKAIERSEKCGDLVNVLDKVITAYDIETAPTIIPAEEGE